MKMLKREVMEGQQIINHTFRIKKMFMNLPMMLMMMLIMISDVGCLMCPICNCVRLLMHLCENHVPSTKQVLISNKMKFHQTEHVFLETKTPHVLD